MKKLLLFLFFVIAVKILSAQDAAAIRDYINRYHEIAVSEMQRTGVPASIKLAQGIHETFAGQSDLVLKSNNHFGIKCKSEWRGESVKHDDDASNECFRKYSSATDSYQDHSNFLRGSERYNFLFQLKPTDYTSWAYGLKKAGYATNPKYAPIIIKLIEEYNLQDYTLIALGQIKKPSADFANIKVETKEVLIPAPGIDTKPGAAVASEIKSEEPFVINKQPKPVYPSGEFKINETKVVYIQEGVSFLSVAGQYAIPLARIFEFNDMKEKEASEKDQLIYLQRKRKTGNNEFHIVRPGETLHDIAQEEALRIESLLEYNFLAPNKYPAVGEKLFLRSKAPAQPKLALKENVGMNLSGFLTIQTNKKIEAFTKTSIAIKHIVAPKETIYSIARSYQVKIEDIVEWNKLSGYDLKTAQQLLIFKP